MATNAADMNSSTTTSSTSGSSLLLERLKRKKSAALRKTVPIARDEEPVYFAPVMDPVLDSPSEEEFTGQQSSADVEKVPPPRHPSKPTQPTYRKWQPSYPETARAKPAPGRPGGSSSSSDGDGVSDGDLDGGRFAQRQDASGESRISADAKAERMTTTTNGAARRSEGSKQEYSRRETIASPPMRAQGNHRVPANDGRATEEEPSSESGESFYSVRSTLPSQRRTAPLQQPPPCRPPSTSSWQKGSDEVRRGNGGQNASINHSPEWRSLRDRSRPNHRLETSQVVPPPECKYPVPELRAVVDPSRLSNKSASTDSNSEPEEDQSQSLPRRPPSPEPPRLYWKNFLRVSHMPNIQLMGELQKAQFDYGNYNVLKSMMRESISRDEVGKHIVAFLNSGDAGEVIIGAMPKNGEMVGVRGMTRRQRDLFRQGFDRFLHGELIKPKIFGDVVTARFYPLLDPPGRGNMAEKNEVQLISIKIEKTGGLDWTDYRMIDGMYKNKLFHRHRGHSVEMTAEAARKRGIQRATAASPSPE